MLKQAFGKCLLFSAAAALMFLTACNGGGNKSDKEYKDQVVIHELSNPQGLNPFTVSDAQATAIKNNIYQSLLYYDMDDESMKLIPWLAKSRPEVTVLPGDAGMEMTYEIREEATWDDGSPITANDVIFSLKAAKCPKVIMTT